ncbi:hypothetical protein LIER_13681 [Lithospermum erythrorhizon]|uniref:Mitochondrial protein n=1 Tax=Lithospermum erythrorhizon TaxID=34254 RepID=A0AAV3PXU6_LITER
MKDLDILKYFLGVEVARSLEGIFLCKRKYVLDIIYEAGLLGAKLVSSPMDQNHILASSTSAPLQDVERYSWLIGRLTYLSFTHPDLSFAVHVFSQFLHEPCQDHWTTALQEKTKKHVTSARSSATFEYRSMEPVTYELKGLLKCLGISHTLPMLSLCDSQYAIHLAQNLVFHEYQLANIFTKVIGKKQFDFLLRNLEILDLHAIT